MGSSSRKRASSDLKSSVSRSRRLRRESLGGRRIREKRIKKRVASEPTQTAKAENKVKLKPRKRKGSCSAADRGKSPRKCPRSISHSDCVFRPGDFAYVVLNSSEFNKIEEDNEPCAKCLRNSPAIGPMIECDRCLAGYHFSCLSPPIDSLPECDWICPVCERGANLPARKAATYRELFLQTDDILTICEISKIIRKGKSWAFLGKRYIRPEATHCGRQRSHGAREIFLLDFCDVYEMERLVRPVNVMTKEDFKTAPTSDDNFFVQSSYDYTTQMFQPLQDLETMEMLSPTDEDSSDGYDPVEESGRLFILDSAARGLVQRQGGGKGAIHEKLRKSFRDGLTAGSASSNDIFKQASCALALTSIPRSLSCRDTEKKKIADFINSFVQTGSRVGSNNCLYICGVPGTGKSTTVLEIIDKFQPENNTTNKPSFRCVEINCFRLPSPQHLYSHLLRSLTDEWLGPISAQRRLMQIFTDRSQTPNSTQVPLLLVVDEIDTIVTSDQKVMYNLAEWCSSKASGLAMIGIANTLDLPERLHPKIKSRMGHERLCFKPYSREQIIKIVENRLDGMPLVFEELAVKMAAAKVAGINGDVRRALELLRVAIDVYKDDSDPEKGSTVKARHIQSAVFRVFQSPINQMLHNTSPLEMVILATLVQLSRASGNVEPSTGEVVDQVLTLLANAMVPPVRTGTILSRISSMGNRRLLVCEKTCHRLGRKVSLNVDQDDVARVIKDEESLCWLRTIVGCKP